MMLNDDSEASNTPKQETDSVLDKELIESVVSTKCTLTDIETIC